MSSIRVGVVYHHDDPDGHVAGGILCNFLQTVKFLPTIAVPKNYNQAFKEWQSTSFITSVIPRDMICGKDTKVTIEVMIFMTDLSFTESSVGYIDEFANSQLDSETFPGYEVQIKVTSIVWIDHHSSSKKALDLVAKHIEDVVGRDNTIVFYYDYLCGAALTWVFTTLTENGYMPSTVTRVNQANREVEVTAVNSMGEVNQSLEIPKALFHLDAYDRWTKLDPDADAWICGLKFYGYKYTPSNEIYFPMLANGETCLKVLTDQFSDACIRTGHLILESQRKVYDEQKLRIRVLNIGRYTVAMKNAIGNSWNFCDYLAKSIIDGGCHYAILGAFDPQVMKYRYSIYRNETLGNDEDIANCRDMAESFGGGGHIGASGFVLKDSLFEMEDVELEVYLYSNAADHGEAFGLDVKEMESRILDPKKFIKDTIFIGGSYNTPGKGVFKVVQNMVRFFPRERICCLDPMDIARGHMQSISKTHIYVFYPGDYSIEEISNLINDLNENQEYINGSGEPIYKLHAFFISPDPDKGDADKKWSEVDLKTITEMVETYPDSVCLCTEETMYFTLGQIVIEVLGYSTSNN